MVLKVLNPCKTEANRRFAHLPSRLALGAAMVYHGAGKLRGSGPEQHGAFFESQGIRPGRSWAMAVGVTELAAGVLTILGIGTRLAALGILVTQATAIAKVHGPKGYAVTEGGFEYNLALMAIAAGLLVGGPDKASLHHGMHRRRARRRMWSPTKPRLPVALEMLQ